ncbi:hypothetical protein PV04_07886 [Phialophora macrospora]|uniref:Uncharacterized protein n=1 Tax=Phialophora macrospora TaxID=1851006 RepID=A0A0D2FFR3_9EURO|nr:hypothetical protein PV04_07886 [Phialophora macrospora]
MVKYTPPPADLSHLNPIQRYMQKGELEGRDWAYLLIFVLAYLAARPAIQRGIKWWMADEELKAGERAQAEFLRSKARVSPDTIRGSKSQEATPVPEGSGDKTTGSSLDNKGKVTNRKAKDRSPADILLEWDDQPERKPADGDKVDVVAWMNRWSNEE